MPFFSRPRGLALAFAQEPAQIDPTLAGGREIVKAVYGEGKDPAALKKAIQDGLTGVDRYETNPENTVQVLYGSDQTVNDDSYSKRESPKGRVYHHHPFKGLCEFPEVV